MIICGDCGKEYDGPAKGTLYVDEDGKSYRVTDIWWHVGKITPHTTYLQTQHPSGGEGQTFGSLLPASARVVWAPGIPDFRA